MNIVRKQSNLKERTKLGKQRIPNYGNTKKTDNNSTNNPQGKTVFTDGLVVEPSSAADKPSGSKPSAGSKPFVQESFVAYWVIEPEVAEAVERVERAEQVEQVEEQGQPWEQGQEREQQEQERTCWRDHQQQR